MVEYVLRLSTGEDILVSELDPESVPLLADPEVARLAGAVLSLCARAPRTALEDAKSGLPEALEPYLGTPPAGCLLKMSVPLCSEVRHCVISDSVKCSTHHRMKRGPAFPMCWTFAVPLGGTPAQSSRARDLSDSIVSAWRDGRHVIVAT
jgi:hypothetical protein